MNITTRLGNCLIILIILLTSSDFALGRLLPDRAERRDPLGTRIPLIAIHGFCGSLGETWNHPGGFRDFFEASDALKSQFKLYYFTYSTSDAGVQARLRPFISDCRNGNGSHTGGRVIQLARQLKEALDNRFGPDREIALLAHSFGGLIARAYMQGYEAYLRTRVLITLATPHHGTLIADRVDRGERLSGLYWDGYDGAPVKTNPLLRCLNGLTSCPQGQSSVRQGTLSKIVAIGLEPRPRLGEPYPDDTLVPIQSALFEEATVRRRYRGTGGEEGTSCQGHFIAHIAIHYSDCRIERDPSTGLALPVFDVIEVELLAPPSNITFLGLGVDFFVNALSGDGSTIVGHSSGPTAHAMKWTASGGVEFIKEAPQATSGSVADAVSADGSVIAGVMFTPDHEAFAWTKETGMFPLGDLPGGLVNSRALAVSDDGSVMAGHGHESFTQAVAVVWKGNDIISLGTLGFFPSSMAHGISGDGKVIVGSSFGATGRAEAVKWTLDQGIMSLGSDPNSHTVAFKASRDGTVLAGRREIIGAGDVAARWVTSGGVADIELLGNLPGGNQANISGMSADGSLIVGTDHVCCPGRQEWFIWDSTNGIRNLKDVLFNEHGIDLTGWSANRIFMSSDGRTIVGNGINPSGQSEIWMISNFRIGP